MNARDIANRRIVTLLRFEVYFGQPTNTGDALSIHVVDLQFQVKRESSPLPARHVQIGHVSVNPSNSTSFTSHFNALFHA